MSVYKSLLLTPGQRQQGAWRGLLNVGQALSAAGAPSTMPTSTMGAFSKGLAAYAPGYDQYANDMRGQKLQDTQYQMQQQQMQQQQMAIDAAKRKKAQEEQQRLAAERYATQQQMGGAQGPTIAAGQAQNRMDPLTLATMQADPVGYMQSAYSAQTANTAADLAHQRALQLKDPNEFTMWMSQNPGKTVSDYMVEKRSRIPVPGTDTPYSPEVLAQRRELAEAEARLDPRRQYVSIEGVGVLDVATGNLMTPGQYQRILSPTEAADAGFQPGTVAQRGPSGLEVLQAGKKITPTGLQEKTYGQTIEYIDAAQESIDGLKAALALSAKAYEGAAAQQRAYAAKNIPDAFLSDEAREGALATGEMDKIIQGQALASLKATFGGMPTEGERKILLDIQGSSTLPRVEREKLWNRAIDMAQKKITRERKKAQDYESRFGDLYSMGYGSVKTFNPETGDFE
jgi:hypothetical protein